MGALPTGKAVSPAAAEEAYLELSERSSLFSGSPVRRTRIVKLSCRLDGEDREIEVGLPLTDADDLVLAIFDHGRFEPYSVFSGTGKSPPAQITRPAVYSVTEYP